MTGTDDTLREIGNDYYTEKDVEEAREAFVDELRAELAELEKQIAAEENANSGIEACENARRLEAEIDACERHAF